MREVESDLERLRKSKDQRHARKNIGKSLDANVAKAELHASVIDMLFPVGPDGKPAGPDVPAAAPFVAEAAKIPSRLVEVRRAAGEIVEAGAVAEEARIAAARFPAPAHTGGKWAATEQGILKAYPFPGRALRASIETGWVKQTEWRSNGSGVSRVTFRYVWAHVAVKKPDAPNVRVFYTSFRQLEGPDGGWGPVEMWGVGGGGCEMLESNLN
ncbi:MAG: hypothetical protein CMJ83_18285 [Planctomycetes bacterium]|nr:hypothetical protein [Planctomycetota bacterium]